MQDLTSQLNPPQKQAVLKLNGPVLILAGAGTGKTKVITHRIAKLMQSGVFGKQIVAVTFTNKAAREMKERVSSISGKNHRVFIGTFHRFCIKLLRKYHKEAGLPRQFNITGSSDQLDFIKKSLTEKNWGGIYDHYSLLQFISNAKNSLLSPGDVNELDRMNNDQIEIEPAIKIYELYERHLVLNRSIDFDDCIFKTVKLLESNSEIRDELHKSKTHYMVDEFQDTNLCQLKLIELLVGENKNICVVGDDDQSIYSWRGAIPTVMQNFQEIYPSTEKIKLEQNYRCSSIILDAANTLIQNNTARESKKLWTNSDVKNQIVLSQFPDENLEANWIATKCLSLMAKGCQPKSIAILLRTNGQAKALELALRASRISVLNLAGQAFFERKEIKDYLAYLKLILNPQDHLSLWRIINTPSRGIGLKTLEKIENLSNQISKAPFQALDHVSLDVKSGMRQKLIDFQNKTKNLHRQTKAGNIEHVIGSIAKEFGLIESIRVNETNHIKQTNKISALKGIGDWLQKEVQNFEGDRADIASEILDMVSLDGRSESDKLLAKDAVRIMTVHASKGLEFENVFVPGLEDGLFPHKNSIETENISEERRLFYVAITRAKARLYISSCRERKTGFQKELKKISRFIKEIEEAHQDQIEWEATMSLEPPTKDQRLDNINKLKGFLNKKPDFTLKKNETK